MGSSYDWIRHSWVLTAGMLSVIYYEYCYFVLTPTWVCPCTIRYGGLRTDTLLLVPMGIQVLSIAQWLLYPSHGECAGNGRIFLPSLGSLGHYAKHLMARRLPFLARWGCHWRALLWPYAGANLSRGHLSRARMLYYEHQCHYCKEGYQGKIYPQRSVPPCSKDTIQLLAWDSTEECFPNHLRSVGCSD